MQEIGKFGVEISFIPNRLENTVLIKNWFLLTACNL